MCATIRRNRTIYFVIRDRRPFAVHLDFVMVTDHAALRRATVHEVTASALAVISVQLGVELPMPPIVADPVISFLRPRGDTEEYGNHADYRHPPRRNHKKFSQWDKKTSAEARCNHLTRCPLESNGLSRATMISPVGSHRESPRGVCNRIPLLSKWHLCSLPRGRGACVAACRDLFWSA